MRKLVAIGFLMVVAVVGQTDVPGHLTVAPDQTNNLDACVKLMSLATGNTAGICAPASLSGSYTVVMPGSNSAGVLTNNGSGGLSWGAGSAPPYADATVMMSSDTAGGHIYKGYSNTSAVFFGMDFYRYGGTIATPADMPASGTMMWLRAYGQRNSSLQESGGIRVLGDGASGNFPTSMIRFTIMDSAGTKFNPLTLRANGELQITDSASVAAGGFRFNGTNLQWSDDLSTWSNFSSGSNWTRAGTTLSPAVAGDDIAVDAVDAAPVGDTGNYVKTRKFEFVDANGGADFFDARAFVHATIGQRYLEFRDNAGTPLVQFWRQETGSVAVDYADVFVDLRPDTDGGQALGSTSAPRYWGSAAINTITANQLTPKSVGNSDIGGTGSAFGDAYVSTLWNNAFRIDSGGGSDMFFEGNLLPWTNEGHNLGAQATRWNVVHGRRWESYDGTYSRIVLNNPGASSNAGSAISVLNASGVSMLSLSYAGSLSSVNITATGNLYTYGVLELEDDDASNYVRIQAPSVVSSNYTITMRASDCAAGEYLTLGSSGAMTCSTPSGAGLPVVDTTSIVEGSSDSTKELRFEVDGFTTGTIRVMTPPNANATLAGTNLAQTWTATQNFEKIAVNSTTWGARANAWADFTSSACGLGWVGNNIYLNQSDNVYKASNTHASLGGSGIQFNTCGSGQSIAFYILATGTVTTADNTVTPTKMWEVNNSGDWMPSSTSRNIGSTATAVGIGYFAQAKYNDGTYDRAGFKCCTGTVFFYNDASNVAKFYVSTAGSLYAANSATTDGPLTFGVSSALLQGATTRIDASGNGALTSLTINSVSTIDSSRRWAAGHFMPSSDAVYDAGDASYRFNTFTASTQFRIWDTSLSVNRFSASSGSVYGYNSSGVQSWVISTVSGTMSVLNWYIANGQAGITATKTVRDSVGTGNCTLVFTGGIYTGGTC